MSPMPPSFSAWPTALPSTDTAPPFGRRALGDDDDRELGAAPLALGDRRGDRLELERDLRDQDGVGARRRAGVSAIQPA